MFSSLIRHTFAVGLLIVGIATALAGVELLTHEENKVINML